MFKKILFLTLFLFCSTVFATSNGARPGHVATPAEGFVKTALLMGNGIVDPNQLIILVHPASAYFQAPPTRA